MFLVFNAFVFQISSLSCRENEMFIKNEPKQVPCFESKLGPIPLRNILGPSFDSTLDQVLTQPFWRFGAIFPFTNDTETTILILFSAKTATLSPPKK